MVEYQFKFNDRECNLIHGAIWKEKQRLKKELKRINEKVKEKQMLRIDPNEPLFFIVESIQKDLDMLSGLYQDFSLRSLR